MHRVSGGNDLQSETCWIDFVTMRICCDTTIYHLSHYIPTYLRHKVLS